jgi:ribonucleoside-diphosphate reductase alpha chain
LEVNPNLVRELKKLDLWDSLKDEVFANQGDVQEIDGIPDEVKAVYKTSFQLSPYAFIEVAARAQKWVDQAISRNMYLETRDIDEYVKIYTEAWKRGLKTTYYLHVKPRHQSEQTTVSIEKTAQTKIKQQGGAARLWLCKEEIEGGRAKSKKRRLHCGRSGIFREGCER